MKNGSGNRVDAPAPPAGKDIADHLPMVQRIVANFMRRLPRSVQREDLVAAGTLGLFQALRSSEHTCPEMFASYARIRIHGSIVDELRRHDWSPRRRKEPAADADRSRAPVDNSAEGPERRTTPRVVVVGFDDLAPHATNAIANDNASPLEHALERSAHEALHAAIEQLPPRERDIIRIRYFQGVSSIDIARAMKLSEARVSQLHARAMKRLRELLRDSAETALAA